MQCLDQWAHAMIRTMECRDPHDLSRDLLSFYWWFCVRLRGSSLRPPRGFESRNIALALVDPCICSYQVYKAVRSTSCLDLTESVTKFSIQLWLSCIAIYASLSLTKFKPCISRGLIACCIADVSLVNHRDLRHLYYPIESTIK